MYDIKLDENENEILYTGDGCDCYVIHESKEDGSCVLEGKQDDGSYKRTKRNPFNNKQECIEWINNIGWSLTAEEKY